MNFIYTPIYVANAGYRPEVGGALVSLGLAPMLLVRVWGRIGQSIGIAQSADHRLWPHRLGEPGGRRRPRPARRSLCMALLCLAAFSATVIDGAGNVPFLRAVHHYERAAMTSVFMTFRHVGSLLIPGVLAVVLWVLPLPFVFVAGGLMTLGMAALSRYLPRRL